MKPQEKTQFVVNPSIDPTILNRSIVIFDAAVEGWEGLAAGVIPGTEVVVLPPQQDGVAQIGNSSSQPQKTPVIVLGKTFN